MGDTEEDNMGFESLPNKLGAIPEFHPLPVQTPPTYNTQAAIAPLLHLADYLSPRKRAMRKAAVAKANYEYRMYRPGGPAEKNAAWMYEGRSLARQIQQARLRKLNEAAQPYQPTNEQRAYMKRNGITSFSSKSVIDAANPMRLNQNDLAQVEEAPEEIDLPDLVAEQE